MKASAIVGGVIDDGRIACRSLMRSGWFAATAIVLLAFGIGVATLALGLVYAVNYRPLPFPAPSELVGVMGVERPECAPSCLDVMPASAMREVREHVASIRGLAMYDDRTAVGIFDQAKEDLAVAAVSDSFFTTLGVRAMVGHVGPISDVLESAAPPVILSYSYWRRHGASRDVLRKTISLDGILHPIAAVMPADFSFPGGTDVWIPFVELDVSSSADERPMFAVGRLRLGANLERANSEVRLLSQQERLSDSLWNQGRGVAVYSLARELRSGSRQSLRLLVSMALVIGIVTYANTQGLFMVRALRMRRAMAIRAAVGAPRWRLAQYWCIEALILVAISCGLAALVFAWGGDIAQASLSDALPPVFLLSSGPALLFFGAFLGLIAALGMGVWAFHSGRESDLQRTLATGATGDIASRTHVSARGALVIVQVVIAIVLANSAVSLYRSYSFLSQVPLGFDANRMIVAALDTRQTVYDSSQQERILSARLLGRLRSTFSDSTIAVWRDASPYTLTAPREPTITLEGSALPIDGRHCAHGACIHPIVSQDGTPAFFRTAGVKIVRGRPFTSQDDIGGIPVAIINEFAAKRWWPNEDAVGKRFKLGGIASKEPWLTVVGIAAASRPIQWLALNLAADPDTTEYSIMFRPLMQVDDPPTRRTSWAQTLWVAARTTETPSSREIRSMGSAIHEIAPELPLGTVSTLRSAMLRRGGWEQIRENRIIAGMLAIFAIILSMAGVYGIIDDLVARRSREMGIRLALGAKPRGLIAMIVRQSFSLAALGALVGTALSVTLRSKIQLWVFGDLVLRQHESNFVTALVLVAITAAAILACLLASWLPAARISLLRPTDVLNSE